MITREGIVIIIMAILFFIVALNVQVGWLYAVVSLLLSVILINIVFPYRAFGNIEIERSGVSSCYEGDSVTIRIKLKNKGKSEYLFKILDSLEGSNQIEYGHFITSIKREEEIEFSYNIKGEQRGIYKFSMPQLISLAPFGIFRNSKRIKAYGNNQFVVFPKIYKLSDPSFKGGGNPDMAYQISISKSGQSENFFGIREYKPGDSLRFIHWRSTAKFNKPVVKEFEALSSPPIAIFIDCNSKVQSGKGKDRTLEKSLSFAASIAVYLSKRNIPFKMIAFDGRENHISSPHIYKNLLWLSSIKGDESFPVKDLILRTSHIISRGSDLLVITPDMSLGRGQIRDVIKKIGFLKFLLINPSEDKIKSQYKFNYRKVVYNSGDRPELILKKLLKRI